MPDVMRELYDMLYVPTIRMIRRLDRADENRAWLVKFACWLRCPNDWSRTDMQRRVEADVARGDIK